MGKRHGLPIAAPFIALALSLALVGAAFGLWSKTLHIHGVVNTGSVEPNIRPPFTDDDNKIDDPALDSGDTGVCQPGENTSCDPAASGADPKPRYRKDVAQCFAFTGPNGGGGPNALVHIINAYPSYYCTAWFPIVNAGSLSLQAIRFDILDGQGNIIVPNAIPSVVYAIDLTGDNQPDFDLHITTIELGQVIEPNEVVMMDLDMHVAQPAPQGTTFEFGVRVHLAQAGAVSGCMGAVFDICIDGDGFLTAGDGLPLAAEVTVGTLLTAFSIEPPPGDRSAVDMFDQDNSGSWTPGDDLHTEAAVFGGIRNGVHDLADPLVLDVNNDLAIGQPVDCDLDTGAFCGPINHTLFKFYDTNNDGYWDSGEDIVLDLNQNGIFD